MIKVFSTLLPFVNGMIDVSDVPDHAKESILSAFESGDYEIIPDPEPIVETPSPDWDGLYISFMVSQSYQYLVQLELSVAQISVAMIKLIDAIQYGIVKPESPAALPAFQSSINLLFYTLEITGQSLGESILTEVRTILDSNNFQSITLP